MLLALGGLTPGGPSCSGAGCAGGGCAGCKGAGCARGLLVQRGWLCKGAGCAVRPFVQRGRLCSRDVCATGPFVQWGRLCNGGVRAMGVFVERGCLCKGGVCAVGLLVQWGRLCHGDVCAMGSFVQRGHLCNGVVGAAGLLVQWDSSRHGAVCAKGTFVQWGHLCNGAVCARGVCLCHGAARAPQALVQRGRWRSGAVEAVVVLVQGGLRVPRGRRCEGAAGAGGCLCSGVCIRPVQQGLGGAFWAPSPPPPRCRQAARLCPRYEGTGWGGSAEHPPSPRPAPFSPFPISWGQNDIPKPPKIHGRARPVPARLWLPRGGLGAAMGLEGGVSPRVPPNLPMHRGEAHAAPH